jgi:hypothetical protein
VKTASLWGHPPSRFYRFLKLVGASRDAEATLAVLGCADGKYVLPAARKQFKVLAVDIDEVSLYGGLKPGTGGLVSMPGLVSRLQVEHLSDQVEVVHGDFVEMVPRPTDAVFISGAIQYSHNLPNTAEKLLTAALLFVGLRGLFYIDYMLPYETKYIGRPNCPDAAWWRRWVSGLDGWNVLHHRVLRPTRDPAHVEFPVDHVHQWGHLLMRRS